DVVCVDPTTVSSAWAVDEQLGEAFQDWYLANAVRSPENWLPLRALRAIVPFLGQLPDSQRAWAWRAEPLAVRMARQHHYDALVSFGQPWSSHLVALSVRRSVRLPWIAHFSDPWSDGDYVKWSSPRVRAYNLKLERRVVSTSDVVVFVNDQARRLYMR